MLSVRNQLWLDTETAEGALATLTVADALWALEAKGEVDRDEFNEARSRRTLSKTVSRIGQSRVKFTFGLDLKGGGLNGSVPAAPGLHKPFLASGMRQTGLWKVAPGLIGGTGSIAHLETFLQASTNATGVIIGSYTGTPTRLHYRATSGTLNNINLVTTSGGATFTPTDPTPVAHGFAYEPTSEIWSSSGRGAWTGTPTQYEIISGNTSGAKGVLLDAGPPLGSPGTIYVQVLLGTFGATEGITGLTSGATATLLTPGFVQLWNTSASIAFLLDGLRMIGTGCRGTFKLPLQTGEPCRVDFEFDGLENAVNDLVIPTGAVFDEVAAPRFVSAGWLLDGFPFYISQLEIDIANARNPRPDANAAEGAISHEITDRDPVVRMDPEMLPPGVYDYFGKWRAGTTAAAKVRLGATEAGIGTATTTGRIVWIDMPAIQYRRVPFGDRNNRVTADIEGGLRQGTTAGNDELIFYFL